MSTQAAASPAVVVRRVFTAPREKVFQAWADPKLMACWFCRIRNGPPTRVIEADVRPGGNYRVEVQGDKLYRGWGTYSEVQPPERLVFTWNWEHDDFADTLVTIDFRALGDSDFTEVTLTHQLLPTEKAREEHRQGWGECFDMLERVLRGDDF